MSSSAYDKALILSQSTHSPSAYYFIKDYMLGHAQGVIDANEWVSVKDRLPIISVENPMVNCKAKSGKYFCLRDKIIHCPNSFLNPDITHWKYINPPIEE